MRLVKALVVGGLMAMTALSWPVRAGAAPREPPPASPAATDTATAPASQVALAPSPALPEPPAASGGARRSTAALIAAGIAVVGAAGATVFGVLALQNRSDYDKHPSYASSGNGNDDAAYADGCLAVAVAAGVTSLLLLLTDDTPRDGSAAAARKRAATLTATPVVTSRGGGAGVLLRF